MHYLCFLSSCPPALLAGYLDAVAFILSVCNFYFMFFIPVFYVTSSKDHQKLLDEPTHQITYYMMFLAWIRQRHST
jgi:hypothetical protein